MSMRNENAASNESTLGSSTSVTTGPHQTSVGTGDPNPKGYSSKTSGTINELIVKLDSDIATFTVMETFTGVDMDALKEYTFTLTCDPEFASFIIPANDVRPWTTPNNKPLHPGDISSSIHLKDPNQQRLNKATPRVSCDVQLKLQKKGATKVLFNADVAGENQPIIKAKLPTILEVTII